MRWLAAVRSRWCVPGKELLNVGFDWQGFFSGLGVNFVGDLQGCLHSTEMLTRKEPAESGGYAELVCAKISGLCKQELLDYHRLGRRRCSGF